MSDRQPTRDLSREREEKAELLRSRPRPSVAKYRDDPMPELGDQVGKARRCDALPPCEEVATYRVPIGELSVFVCDGHITIDDHDAGAEWLGVALDETRPESPAEAGEKVEPGSSGSRLGDRVGR